ncbi:MAG: DNA repair and recombination protein RadB [archaeon]|nr:DNA repair and recombination protein RadB [archaeon]
MKRIPTGCNSLDNLLGGGLETGSVTLFYGEAGTGKTNICLQTAYNVVKAGMKVAYIDTEGLSPDRIEQIFIEKKFVKDLLIFQVYSFEEQSDKITKVYKLSSANDKIGLIVIDSMTMFYRLHSDDMLVRNDFVRQTETLLNTARQNDIVVLLTSQVYTNIGSGSIEFLGGNALYHNAKTIIRLDKKNNGRRTAVITKHRSIPDGKYVNYHIASTGIESD